MISYGCRIFYTLDYPYEAGEEMTWLWRNGEEPRDIPQWAFIHLAVVMKLDVDRLSLLKCVEQMDFLENRPVHLIRMFDPDAARGTEIRDFASLDRYPELILYEGHRDMETGKINIFPAAL